MPSITIIWNAINDARTCPICRAVHGYAWTFTTPAPLPQELVHPQYGVIWNLSQGSKAHGHSGHNCRCSLHMGEPDLSDVQEWAEKKLAEFEALKT